MSRRRALALVAHLVVSALVLAPLELRAAPAPTVEQEAATFYHEGEDAYRLGKFDVAIEKFERAYSLSKKPSLLYNVGLAYQRNYELSRRIEDLRSAKVVLDNYLQEIEKNPEVGDLHEAQAIIASVEADIARAEAGPEAAPSGGGEPPPAGADEGTKAVEAPPAGDDPGRRLRRWGVTGLVLGTGGVLVGVASGVTFAVFRNAKNKQGDYARARTLNALALGLGIGFSLVGAAVLTGGAILFTKGKKKTAAWKAGDHAELFVLPNGPAGASAGASLAGRF